MSVVFSIDKKKVSQSFASAAKSYDGLATLQRKVGLNLLAFSNKKFTDDCVVDIGCGTGFLTLELMQREPVSQMIAIDIALSMLQVTRAKLEQVSAAQYVCADAECLPLLESSVDRIVSNLALQWCQNLALVFEGFNKVLKQEGDILFSTFGPQTLQELRQSWSEVDSYTHVNNFYSVDELFVFLKQAGFKNIRIETKQYQSNYQSVVELMRELKGIGARNNLSGRNRKTTRKTDMQNMISVYENYRTNGLIPATYEVIFIVASVS